LAKDVYIAHYIADLTQAVWPVRANASCFFRQVIMLPM